MPRCRSVKGKRVLVRQSEQEFALELMPELALVDAARTGDKTAFGVLMDHYRDMVQRIMLSRVDDREIAYDLTQETLLQAYLSLDHLRDGRYFKSWLYGIAVNVCRSYFRTNRTSLLSFEALTGGTYREPAA